MEREFQRCSEGLLPSQPHACVHHRTGRCAHTRKVFTSRKSPSQRTAGAAPEECPQHSRSACAQQPARTWGRGQRGLSLPLGGQQEGSETTFPTSKGKTWWGRWGLGSQHLEVSHCAKHPPPGDPEPVSLQAAPLKTIAPSSPG